MMFRDYVLYVDNFRGFSDAYIPLLDVNFLVGENSTGKTSILSLLDLLSDSNFLYLNQFANSDVDLGTYDDIVSSHAKDPKCFRVGLLRRESGKRGLPIAILITYEKHEGLPRDLSISCTVENHEITVRRDGANVKIRANPRSISRDTKLRSLLKGWIAEHESPSSDYVVFDRPVFPGQSLLGPLTVSVREMMERKVDLNTNVFPGMSWIAPIREKPSRTYDALHLAFSPDGRHAPYLIRRLLDTPTSAQVFHKAIRVFGKSSGLFDDVDIRRFDAEPTSPFQVHIRLHEKAFNLVNVGYGVSQALPVIIDMLWSPDEWIAVQQPEVHLHPRAQAAFGDLVFAGAITRKKFLIETHSDYLIDRFRIQVRSKRGKKPTSQVLYFERKNGLNVVYPLAIGEEGDLPARQPRGYRDFFVKEQMELLGF